MGKLNESVSVDDIMKMAMGVSNIVAGNGNMPNGNDARDIANTYSYSSIAKAASKLIAIFPVLVSRTVSQETANMVTRYTEQKACNLFQLALQQANISSAANGVEYLKNFHQNLDGNYAELDTIIKTMTTWLDAYQSGSAYNSQSRE